MVRQQFGQISKNRLNDKAKIGAPRVGLLRPSANTSATISVPNGSGLRTAEGFPPSPFGLRTGKANPEVARFAFTTGHAYNPSFTNASLQGQDSNL